jgi:hypothetical protein
MHEAETPPWIIHSERIFDDTRRAILSIADVELPDGTRFEQWVHRSPAAAMAALVVDEAVLMLRRHRFVIDRWIFELPGGYCEPKRSSTALQGKLRKRPGGVRSSSSSWRRFNRGWRPLTRSSMCSCPTGPSRSPPTWT